VTVELAVQPAKRPNAVPDRRASQYNSLKVIFFSSQSGNALFRLA
jgi:hypothetical protein